MSLLVAPADDGHFPNWTQRRTSVTKQVSGKVESLAKYAPTDEYYNLIWLLRRTTTVASSESGSKIPCKVGVHSLSYVLANRACLYMGKDSLHNDRPPAS